MSDTEIESLPVSPARNTDPVTAHIAAAANEDVRGEQRVAAYKALDSAGERGLNDWELSVEIGALRTSAGSRRKELERAGLVVNSGKRRPTDTGSTAIVWILAKYVIVSDIDGE